MTCQPTDKSKTINRVVWYKGSKMSKNRIYGHISGKPGVALNDWKNKIVVGQMFEKIHKLYINRTILADEDTYFCDTGDSTTSSALLTVNVKPEGVTITGLAQPVRENTQVEVMCHVTRVKPEADIYWRKGLDGSPQPGTTKTVTDSDTSDGAFQVSSTYKVSVSRSDRNKTLYCLITPHGTGFWNNNTGVTINVTYPPSAKVKQTSSGNPKDGSSVTLTCDITAGNPTGIINVTWKKGSIPIISSTGSPYKQSGLSGRDLKISPLDHSRDDDNYSCAAQNAAGTGHSSPFQLLVNYKPTVSAAAPDPVVEGQSVTITCQSQGARPSVNKVTWKKGQEIIRVVSDIRYAGGTVQTPSLTIKLATRKDVGEYTCQLNNIVGHGNRTIELQLWYRPYGNATMGSEAVSVSVGGHVLLACDNPTEPGNPVASWFIWRKQNSDFISNTTRFLILTPSSVNESGKYSCVAGNWVGQSDYSDWTTVTVQVPPETPTRFIILNNSTSVALTLQWQPGFSGIHLPQLFNIRYMAVTEPDLIHERALPAGDSKQQQVTIVGLEPETLYKFTLFARSNNTDVIRSGVATTSGRTTASPEVEIETVDIQEDHMTVTWSDNRQSSRRKRPMPTAVAVVILYQRDGGKEGRYPPEGSVDAKQQTAVISGQFYTEATYKIWLKVYEGQLTFPSKIAQPVEHIGKKGRSSNMVTIVAAIVGGLLVVSICSNVFCYIWIRRQKSNYNEGSACERNSRKQQQGLEMTDDISSYTNVNDDTKQYQHLKGHAAGDMSTLRERTYTKFDQPEATQGAAYDEIDVITQQKHTYVNTPKISGVAGEYAEVT